MVRSAAARRAILSACACSTLLVLPCDASLAAHGRQALATAPTAPFDVLRYDARVEPDIAAGTVTGTVSIQFTSRTTELGEIALDRGGLTIDAVRADGGTQRFAASEGHVAIALSRPAHEGETRTIEIDYHGAPRRGIRFFPERDQVYTVFSTSQWLVCVDAPDDKAALSLTLVLPARLAGVASGRLVSQRALPNGRTASEWRQEKPVSTYTFGFAAGPFHEVTERHGPVQLRSLATQFSGRELRRIFRDTGDMFDFYETRAGVRYPGPVYTQVLAAGGVEQEMSGFTALRDSYGGEVLANERAVWLGAHELAHQWWGNMVTCRAWTHFWLNEGVADFMTAAWLEHRFGREEYLRRIEAHRASYEKVRAAGHDRSLVFPDWLHPTADDRALVYDKGAWVLHLLREELGERAFWTGLRDYTREYWGKSVTTADFQAAMEHASGRSLTAFFAQWVEVTP